MKKMRELRKMRGMTAKQLGNVLNVAESTISLYENGKRAPDYEMLKKISAYFGVSVDYLLDNSKPDESTISLFISEFGKSIKQAREQKGISQKEFAEIIGVPANTLCQWETGKREPDYQMLKKIADILEVSTDYLLGREENDISPSFNELHCDSPYFKKSTPYFTTVSDQQDREFIELYSKLTPEERQFVLSAIKGMLSKQ